MHSRNAFGRPVGIDRPTADEADPQNVMEKFGMEYPITDNERLDDFIEYVIDFYSEEMCSFRREEVLYAMALAAFKGRYSEVPFEGDSFDRVFIAGLLMEIRKNEKNVPVKTAASLGVK